MIMKLLPAASDIRAKVIFLYNNKTHSFSIEKTQKVFMKDVIAGVLSKKIQKEVLCGTKLLFTHFFQNPILSKYKFPLKKTKQEVEEKRKQKEDRIKKEERKQKGHYIPQYELDRARENKLKATAMRGGTDFSSIQIQ